MATTKYFVAAGNIVAILQPLGAEPEVRATTKDATFDEGWNLGGGTMLLRKGKFLAYIDQDFVELREVEDAPEAPATPAPTPKPAPARSPRIAALRRCELPPLPEGGCHKCSGTRTYKGYGGKAKVCLACVRGIPGVWENTDVLDDEPVESTTPANG